MINVIGGVYRERCLKPSWDHIYGSAGRASLAIAEMGTAVKLHSYICDDFLEEYTFKSNLYSKENFIISRLETNEKICFNYNHGLDPLNPPIVKRKKNIKLDVDNALVFGMLECDFEIKADYVVYDPQNTFDTQPFSRNGSIATHLALVLNENEARVLDNSNAEKSIVDIIDDLHKKESAEVIIVKRGPEGAIVSHSGRMHKIPAFKTETVWKIGSGDCFSAHFANNWIISQEKAEVAAYKASLATAFYCSNSLLPSPHLLKNFKPEEISVKHAKSKPIVYIASPFFSLSQLWLVEQIRFNLNEMGLEVISPYHDIGLIQSNYNKNSAEDICIQDLKAIEKSDLIFGVLDGNDTGTIFEIGYATSLNKKIILLSENGRPEDLIMFHSINTKIVNDYVTAIYKTIWETL